MTAKPRRPDIRSRRMPPQPTDCRDAMHWFVDNFALYTGSVRGLFVSDFSPEYDAYIESSVINLRSRGIEPFLATGDQLVAQAEALWMQATAGTPFNQPHVTMFELDMLRADVAIIKDLEAPVSAPQLWYLFHYVIYPRALFNKATVVTTSLGLDELIAYGAECDDVEYAGRKISWEKLIWLIEATMIDLYQFRQVKTDGHPPMLKAEYNLFKAMNERELPVTAQQVLGDYMLDMSIADRDNRLAIEVDVLASLDPNVPNSGEAKKNLVLLSDGWKILRFTTAEILGDLTACVDAVEQVWSQGRKKSAVGRLMSGRDQPKIPELPVDDDSQKLAITHGAGPVAVTGGAGTGKTSCVTHRIGYLLAQGVCPERILVFTHSEETLAQLKRKVEILTDGQTVQRISFSDWKDLGLRILKENAGAVKRKPPLKMEAAPHRVLQRVLKKELKDIDPLQLELMEADIDEVSIGTLISLYKANLVTPERIKERATTDAEDLVARLYLAYEDALRKSNKVDPDDCISLCAQLLADDPAVRAKYQHKYEYVLVDEYQDCTAAADLMARLLAFPQDNLFLVGDEDECVTENKGALPRMMADTSIRMPNARCYVLDKNWRSHPAIVDHSRSLASAFAIKGIFKDMIPGFGTAATSAVIGPQQCRSEEAEADWVASEVSILVESGKSPGDIVILWRNARYASLLEAALFKKSIKCVSAVAPSDAVPDEVGDVMAFLRLVMDPDGPKARASFERFCQLKSREMDQKLSRLSNTIASFAEANNLSFLKAIEIYHDATADSSCEDLAQLVRIVRTMHQEALPPAQTIGLLKRTQKLNEIYSAVTVPPGVVYEPMRKVEQLEEEAKAYSTVREFVKAKQDFLENKDTSAEEASVNVKSFEDAKGGEYPIAFLTGMAEGLSPAETAPNFEEERRLCYVAMTRAKELLYISYPATFDEKQMPPSPFLVESRLLGVNVYRKAVDLINAELPPKPAAAAEPVMPGSGMLTPIMTGRPERKPAAPRERPGRAGSGGAEPGATGGAGRGQGPPPRPTGGNRPGSDVADLLGGRIISPGAASSDGGGGPVIRPAGYSTGAAPGPDVAGTPGGLDPAGTVPGISPDSAGMPPGSAGVSPENASPVAGTPGSSPGGARHVAGIPGNSPGGAGILPASPAAGAPGDVAGTPGGASHVAGMPGSSPEGVSHVAGIPGSSPGGAGILPASPAASQPNQPVIHPAGHIANLARGGAPANMPGSAGVSPASQDPYLQGIPDIHGPNPYVGPEIEQRRVIDEAKQRAENEEKLRIQYEAHVRALQQQQNAAELEAQKRAEQAAYLRMLQEQQMREQQEAMMRAQQEEMLRRAQEEAHRREHYEARMKAEQEAELRAQQEAEIQAQQEAALRAQQEAEQRALEEAEAERLAKAEAERVMQEAFLRAQQEAALQAQQEAALQSQQEAALQAQQEAALQAQQEAALQSQQEAELRAQQEAEAERVAKAEAERVMQEAFLRAQQEAALQAQQQAAANQPVHAQDHPAHPASDALQRAQQHADSRAQQDASIREQQELHELAAAKAKEDALRRVQEKATQRALIDLDLRMQQEMRNLQPDQQQSPAASTPEPEPVPPLAGSPPAGVDIQKLVDEQFSFGPSKTEEEAAPPEPPAPKPVDPERAKAEDMVRSNKEILEELSPVEREKQQDILRKKAREKIVAKGRKKKGAAAESPPEPVADVAPAAVSKPEPQPEPMAPPVFQEEPAPEPPPPAGRPPQPAAPQPAAFPGFAGIPQTPQSQSAQRPLDSTAAHSPDPIASQVPMVPTAPTWTTGTSPTQPETAPDSAGILPALPETAPAKSPPEPITPPAPQPHPYGDPGMVGGVPSAGVTVHRPAANTDPALPDLTNLQNPSWPETPPQPASPPAVPAPPLQPPAHTQPPPPMPVADQQPPVTPVLRPIIPKDAAGPICPQCSVRLEANARFCGECGYHLPVRIPACPSCQLPLEPSAKFCGECGYSLQ